MSSMGGALMSSVGGTHEFRGGAHEFHGGTHEFRGGRS